MVDQEIRQLIERNGQITFAQFMQVCLYSPHGGFYSARTDGINAHFGTSPASHPAFGALIARQLEQMWHILEEPPIFYVLEVGSGDGLLARSIWNACRRATPQFARALRCVAADYRPALCPSPAQRSGWPTGDADAMPKRAQESLLGVQQVRAEGVGAFRGVIGCILSNELIDNFPVHRFAIQGGKVREVFVTLAEGNVIEVLGEPSCPGIEERLASLESSLAEGYRGEVCLALADWTSQIFRALDQGFVLTIDYGELADDLYSPRNSQGTLICYRGHTAGDAPYRYPGQQDITCQVDFTSLMRLGARRGLPTVGYALQSEFLNNLGFSDFLEGIQSQGLSAARTEFDRIALMALVDPEEYGNLKVLAQAKGVDPGVRLLGF